MPKKTQDGYVFYENQNYLRKIGTREFFIYSEALAKREDMMIYNPLASDDTKEIKKAPGVDDETHSSNLTKEFIGLTREEIRATVKEMNRPQRLLWAIDLLFQQLPIHDLTQFSPSRGDIMKIIGPPVSAADILHAVEKYKTNPTNIKALIAEAHIADPPEPEGTVMIKETDPDDPLSTFNFGSESTG